jgi:hypothetical protein
MFSCQLHEIVSRPVGSFRLSNGSQFIVLTIYLTFFIVRVIAQYYILYNIFK